MVLSCGVAAVSSREVVVWSPVGGGGVVGCFRFLLVGWKRLWPGWLVSQGLFILSASSWVSLQSFANESVSLVPPTAVRGGCGEAAVLGCSWAE